MPRILALIPARAGSKSIPDKNIVELAGHPMLAYSIAAARLSRRIDRVIVTTDSPHIAGIAKQYGAEVPFLRPAEISADASLDIEFVTHALEFLERTEGYVPDLVVHLRPTTPWRLPEDIDRAIREIEADEHATALRSAHRFRHPAYKLFRFDGPYCRFFGGGDLEEHEYYNLPRQALPETFVPNGVVDILIPRVLAETGLLHGPRIRAFVTEETADVDAFEDLELANRIAGDPRYRELMRRLDEARHG